MPPHPPAHHVARHLRATGAGGQGYIGRHVPAPSPDTPVRVAIPAPPARPNPWPGIAALTVIVACLGLFAWTLPPSRPDATIIAGRAGQ